MDAQSEERLVTRALSLCVQQPTLSDAPCAVFKALHKTMSECFPLLFSKSEIQVVNDRALLLCLPGAQTVRPLLFLSHMDVVPAKFPKDWKYPPFSGKVLHGYVHGRGTLDMKGHMCALLTAIESLLTEGFAPKGDLYFAFSSDEETRGNSMQMLRDLLRAKGVSPAFVLDEGGFVTPFTSHHKSPAALVGVAEKGHIKFSITAQNDMRAERLLKTGVKLTKIKFAPRITPTVEQTIKALSTQTAPLLQYASNHMQSAFFKNMWVKTLSHQKEYKKLVQSILELQQLSGDALYYQTPKLTYYASLLHGDSAENFINRLNKTLKNSRVDVHVEIIEEPSMLSPAHGAAFDAIKTAIQVHFPHVPIAPCLLPGGSDARHMEMICPNVYRFSPFVLTKEERATIHHTDEKISIQNLLRGVQFFKQVLQA